MNWKKFDEIAKEYPEAIVEKRIAGFENATDALAGLSLAKLEGAQFMTTNIVGDFRFSLYLYSPYLKSYRFKILTFGYGIRFSPINFTIEESIDQEIFGEYFVMEEQIRSVENTDDFDKVLNNIFSSKAFETVVGGLIKLAKRERTNF